MLSRLTISVDRKRNRLVVDISCVVFEECSANEVLAVVLYVGWNAKSTGKVPSARLGQRKRFFVFDLRWPETEVFLLNQFAKKLDSVQLIIAVYSFNGPSRKFF